MDINVFILELKKSLMKRGIQDDIAQKYITAMTSNMSSTQRQQIQSYNSSEDFSRLSDNLAMAIKKKETVSPEETQTMTSSVPLSTPNTSNESNRKNQIQHTVSFSKQPNRKIQYGIHKTSKKREISSSVNESNANKTFSEPKKSSLFTTSEPLICGPNGKKYFKILCISLSPLLLALTILYFTAFGLLYLLLSLFIALCVLFIIVGTTACGGVSVAGIIYGVMQYFNEPCEGKYEVGLALIIIGSVVLIDTICYHAALNWLPRIYKYIKRLFFFVSHQVIRLALYLRKECYKL